MHSNFAYIIMKLTHSGERCIIFELAFSSMQVYHDSEEGQRYIQFYKLNKFPYISILDPRTGEFFTCVGNILLLHVTC